MLKQIAALGTTVKDRKPPLSSRKRSPYQVKESFSENNTEILELSPLARFMAAFHHTECRHETHDQIFSFILEADGDICTIYLKGRLNLQDHSWNVSWVTNAGPVFHDTGGEAGFLAELQHFLKANGIKQNLGNGKSFSLILHGFQGLEKLAQPGTGLLDILHHLLMQVLILSNLPHAKGHRKQRQHFGRTTADNYQALRGKCSFFFPPSGLKELALTLNALRQGTVL